VLCCVGRSLLFFFAHCVVCPSIYWFWLPIWYILAICFLSFDLRILIAPMVYIDHCVVCPSIYGFWLPLWYILAIVLSVLRFTDSNWPYGIHWPLCCLSFFDLRILIAPIVSIGHCVVCPSSIYRFWLPIYYLLAIVLSVLLRFTDSDCPYGIYWSLCCLSFDLRILIAPIVSIGHCVVCPSSIYGFWLPLLYLLFIVLSVLLRFTDSDCPYGIYWPLCCLSFFDLRILIAPMVSIGHCVVCPSSIYGFWLPLWYLLAIVLSVLLRFTDSDCPYGIYWPLCCLSFFDLRILIAPMVSIGHCVVCSSSIYGFLLPLWYILAIVLSVLLQFTDSDCRYDIYWSLCCLSFDLRILIAAMVYIGHCVVCPSIYWFWLPLWYLLVIVLSVLRITDYNCPYGINWSLCCLSCFD
jgi:hypothetical protein